jgi:hypothetical protein
MIYFLCLVVTSCCTLFAAEMKGQAPNLGSIRIVPVDPTPEPDHVELVMIFPKHEEMRTKAPIQVQIRLDGYAVGTNSDFPRSREIFNDPKGQAVHIIVDNHTYFEINESIIDALDDTADYYEQILEKAIPFKLEEGAHLIRTFPVRSFNESLKGDRCFLAVPFYFKSKTGGVSLDLTAPYLTYNEPVGQYPFHPTTPILLDFYITNCQLSKDGYKVRLTIDGNERTLTQWVPYYIYGLTKGTHTIRLELLDPQNKPLSSRLSDHTETITLK